MIDKFKQIVGRILGIENAYYNSKDLITLHNIDITTNLCGTLYHAIFTCKNIKTVGDICYGSSMDHILECSDSNNPKKIHCGIYLNRRCRTVNDIDDDTIKELSNEQTYIYDNKCCTNYNNFYFSIKGVNLGFDWDLYCKNNRLNEYTTSIKYKYNNLIYDIKEKHIIR